MALGFGVRDFFNSQPTTRNIIFQRKNNMLADIDKKLKILYR